MKLLTSGCPQLKRGTESDWLSVTLALTSPASLNCVWSLKRKAMFKIILPDTLDNRFPGHSAALLLFYAITLLTLGRSLAHTFLPDGGAQTIATIPLDDFSDPAAATVVSIFAFWGWSQLLLGILMALAAIRYQSMVPLFYLIVLLEYLGRIFIGYLKPLLTVSTPPGKTGNYINGTCRA